MNYEGGNGIHIFVRSGYNGTAQGTSFRSVPLPGGYAVMRRMFIAAATVAALGIAGAAAAQSPTQSDLTPVNVTIRGGATIPLDSELTNLGNTLLDLGVEYQLPESLFGKLGETFVSLDYWGKGITFGQGSVVPLMLNQRWYVGGTQRQRSYFFLGAGVAFVDVASSNSAVGLRGGIGQELGDHIIGEIAGYISDRAGNARANAVTFCVGYRW